MIDEYVRIYKVLADKTRLKIIASLNKEPMYVELISERVGINPSTVSFHLKKLERAELVTSKKDQYYVMYYLNKEKLNYNNMQAINKIALKSDSQEKKEEAYYDRIKFTFFKNGKLVSIPVQRKKREVILKELAKSFEVGKEYPEREVNLIISEFHDDFCTLRREFIMTKLFERENGIYIRIK